MDRKTKHRLLGILVVIGLIIILIPFFRNNSDVPTQSTLKAPPFPDESAQVSPSPQEENTQSITSQKISSEDSSNPLPDDTISPSETPIAQTSNIPAVPPLKENADENETISNKKVNENNEENIANQIQSVTEGQEEGMETSSSYKHKIEKIEDISPAVKIKPAKHAITSNRNIPRLTKAKSYPITNTPLHTNGLAELNNSVWVIQMGSFKNKTNALRLVNKLRNYGYKAFIQQVSTLSGNSTRVFVGPENKQTAARALALQLESEFHLRGMVISYKPLTM